MRSRQWCVRVGALAVVLVVVVGAWFGRREPDPADPAPTPPAPAAPQPRAARSNIPQWSVALPADPTGLASADCDSWSLLAWRARRERSPSVFDATFALPPPPAWLRSRLYEVGVRPVWVAEQLVDVAPRAAMTAMELDGTWTAPVFEGPTDPRGLAVAELLADSPDPEVAEVARIELPPSRERARQLVLEGRTDNAVLAGLQARCGADRAWGPDELAVLRAALAADHGRLRVEAALALLRHAWNDGDAAAVRAALADVDAARAFCREWGEQGHLRDDPRLARAAEELDEAVPPRGPRGMREVAAQLEAAVPELGAPSFDCVRFPCTARYAWAGGDLPRLPEIPGVRLVWSSSARRWSLFAVGTADLSDADAVSVADLAIGRAASRLGEDHFGCVRPEAMDALRVEVADRIGLPGPDGWRGALTAAAFACHRGDAGPVVAPEVAALVGDGPRWSVEGPADPFVACVIARAPRLDGPPRARFVAALRPAARLP